jgi:hypothetical protein
MDPGQRARSGLTDWVAAFRQHYSEILGWAERLTLRSSVSAEDLVAYAFDYAWEHEIQANNPAAWVTRFVRCRYVEQVRRNVAETQWHLDAARGEEGELMLAPLAPFPGCGHPRSPENTRWDRSPMSASGKRPVCRECERARGKCRTPEQLELRRARDRERRRNLPPEELERRRAAERERKRAAYHRKKEAA